jgi:hypothetical protein
VLGWRGARERINEDEVSGAPRRFLALAPVRLTVVALVALAAAAVVGVAPAWARSTRPASVPHVGDWEGSGPHGIPLSFELVRRHGRVVATSIAFGAPTSCPATPRDTEVLPLFRVAYHGPGGAPANVLLTGGLPVTLSGKAPDHLGGLLIAGTFTTHRRGWFRVTSARTRLHCGWPTGARIWRVHLAHRRPVKDASWTAPLTGAGITGGSVDLAIVGQGRAVRSFAGQLDCQSSSEQGTESFGANPAYEFVRADGSFYSPQDTNLIQGVPTLWKGTFSATGALSGTLRIYDPCTKAPTQLSFTSPGPT